MIFEYPLDPSCHIICGVDEVGRGPLVGDVVTAAVILDPAKPVAGLADSKKLSEKKRDALYSLITENARAYAIGRATPEEIDGLNILQATMLAMKRAVASLPLIPEFVLVDGNRLPDWEYPSASVVKGDSLVPEISAASILAKVTRDREMKELALKYPQYGYEKNKGYPTAQHLSAIKQYGITPLYRKSFGPVAAVLGAEYDR